MNDRKIDLPEGVPPLSSYYVYLTGGCNLACKHCYITPTFMPNGGTGGHLDFELFKLAVEEGLPLGLQSVKLTGGEPLLHPDFIRIVDLIRENGLSLTIETNGTLMTPELARYLREKSTLRHISVSLDGATSGTHDAFRGVKGSFDKACAGIQNLVEVGFRPQIIMSLHIKNANEIEELVRLSDNIGAGSVKFNLIQSSGRGDTLAERNQVLNISKLIDIGRWVEKDLQKITSIPLHYSWPMAFKNLSRLTSNRNENCGIMNILGILSTGHIAMCGIGVHIADLCYGLLGVNSISNIWISHPFLQKLRTELPKDLEGICSRCIFRDRCMGHCVAYTYLKSESILASYSFCRDAEQLGLFPSTRTIPKNNKRSHLNTGV